MSSRNVLPDSPGKWTVWVNLCGNGEVVSPFFFPGNVNGEVYLDKLNNNVVPILSQHYPREWPPRSPDLTPCGGVLFLWRYLKSRVYQTPPQNLEDLCNRITAEVHSLPRDMVRRAVMDMESRACLCIERMNKHKNAHFVFCFSTVDVNTDF